MAEDGRDASGDLGFRPLYQQVRARIVERMLSGDWAPGAMLPSESQIAAELGVSQGTVRKALDALHAENLVVRRQGRGTFVAEHTAERAMFHFFRLVGPDGTPALPETVHHALSRGVAAEEDAARFGLPARAPLWQLVRHRALGGQVVVSEEITLPAADFPGLDAHEPLPNNVYSLYEKLYGRTVARAEEHLSATAAPPIHARALGLKATAPVLLIDRIAFGLDDRPIERRLSWCRTDTYRYRADLR